MSDDVFYRLLYAIGWGVFLAGTGFAAWMFSIADECAPAYKWCENAKWAIGGAFFALVFSVPIAAALWWPLWVERRKRGRG